MKKLIYFILVAVALSSCDCKNGYGPSNCKETWASKYAGNWIANVNCSGQVTEAQGNISEESPTSIIIDNEIIAELNDWDSFSIPSQQLNGSTITGIGGIKETTNHANGGVIISSYYVWFNITVTANNQTTICTSNYTR